MGIIVLTAAILTLWKVLDRGWLVRFQEMKVISTAWEVVPRASHQWTHYLVLVRLVRLVLGLVVFDPIPAPLYSRD